MNPVYNYPPIQKENIINYTLQKLDDYLKKDLISSEQKNKIEHFLAEFLPQFFNLNNYSQQITLFNYFWWKKIFREKLPNLFCFDAEDIVKNSIIECFSER
jgi:hypothetical protein